MAQQRLPALSGATCIVSVAGCPMGPSGCFFQRRDFLCMGVVPAYLSVYPVYAWWPDPLKQVTDSYELPFGC